MFSIFDYLRRRTCDSFLAGAYDAIEILETENAKLPAPSTESAGTNSDASKAPPANLLAAPKNGVAQKILPLAHATPPAKAITEQKTAPSPEKKESQKPAPQAAKPTTQPVSPHVIPIQPSPRTDLFTGDDSQEKPLPPRKRGRPRKNPPDGNSP